MGLVFVILIIFALLIGAVLFFVFKSLKKVEAEDNDKSMDPNIQVSSDILPLNRKNDGFTDMAIDLGNFDYRAIIECTSVNYNLKTDAEKQKIEASFTRFLNSLHHPITLYIQTRRIDNTKIMDLTKNDIKKSIEKYPKMSEYGKVYLENLNNITEYIGNNKQKKKFVIVPYNEARNLNELSDSEKEATSMEELRNRCLNIIDGLSSFGIKCKLYQKRELMELVYSAYHKDNYTDFEKVENGEFLSLVVSSKDNPARDISNEGRLDWILYEAQKRIEVELLNKGQTLKENEEYANAIKKLGFLRSNK